MPDESTEPTTLIEKAVGHPQEKWDSLKQVVQDQRLRQFSDVQALWLDLMWCLDAYRVAGVPARGMGNPHQTPGRRLEAVNKSKGNWFASLLTLLLENQTTHRLAPRVRVQGFSQTHQIDVAWPDRDVDPLLCLETKVTGAPAHGETPARKATGDWSNRRKELKFAATDLKLFRRQNLTSIEHWDVWRASTYPKTYFLWAARLSPTDDVAMMTREAQTLVKTYLEGAGIVAWKERDDHAGYEAVSMPPADRVSTVDDVLYRIATEIRQIAPPGEQPPPPELPPSRVVNPQQLESDE